MTSNAACVKRIYYHGGKSGLAVGGYILPAAETGYTKLDRRLKDVFGEYDEDVYDMNLVYTTTQAECSTVRRGVQWLGVRSRTGRRDFA
jgi:hypothetical protein